MVTIRFTENDYKKLVGDYPDYPFYSKKGGSVHTVYSEKNNKVMGRWNERNNTLSYNSRGEIVNWLKENSYL